MPPPASPMYPAYFGLKEPSFSITPDPQYLYLSPRHEEALAHLLYGTGDSGGFVMLTGEVGTGKTTVCRAFLERLPEQVDIALILNPALSVIELLQSICTEFGIEIDPRETSTKALVDQLNSYLLEAHAIQRRPVLMIDEAQNLAPEVLEQVRLLTNLETAKHKLLQIFLVGQPELRDLLQQQNLRQLSQRITARYHLTPLDRAETETYIRHRLAVAGVDRPLFTPGALRQIYRFTGGVPRLINILCDRTLLGAYAGQKAQVDAGIVKRSWQELHAGDAPTRPHGLALALGLGAAMAVSAATAWLTYPWSQPAPNPTTSAQQPQASAEPAGKAKEEVAKIINTQPDISAIQAKPTATPLKSVAPTSAPAAAKPDNADNVFDRHILDRQRAMTLLLRHWALDLPSGVAGEPCDLAERHGLLCKTGVAGRQQIQRYNRPALLRIKNSAGQTGHILLTGLGEHQAELDDGDSRVRVPLQQLSPQDKFEYLLLWRPAPGRLTLIGANTEAEGIRWLREQLARLPDARPVAGESSRYDQDLRDRVKDFQASQGLLVDGVAGPETLIHLNTQSARADIPHLHEIL